MARTLYQVHTEPVSTSSETVTVDRWLQPLSEPLRRATLPIACTVAALAWAGVTPQGDANSAWGISLSTPVRTPAALHASLQQAHAEPVSTSPETVTESRWHVPLSEPVRQRAALPAALQQTFAVDPTALTVPEAVHVAAWAQPWSTPRWSAPAIQAAAQQALAWSGFTSPPSVTSWLQPFSEPQHRRRGVAHLTPAAAWPPLVATTPVVTPLLGWLQPFSNPFWPRVQPIWQAPAFVWLEPVQPVPLPGPSAQRTIGAARSSCVVASPPQSRVVSARRSNRTIETDG